MSIKLKQPIINGSLRATNFFNGRLVTGADMTREQTSRREAVWRVGKAAGEGIVYGLEVEKDKDAGTNPIVSVSKGLAVNRCGQALYLSDDTSVDLLQRFGTVDQPSTIFGDCQPLAVGTYTAGFGYYLLVLSPVESSEGSAQTSGLNNVFATCNTNVILETVQFNLLPIDSFLKKETFPPANMIRNHIAYKCFGVAKSSEFFNDPLGVSLASYGLLDEMRGKSLSDSDVPLAIINWTSNGLEFVETWAVRRRVTRKDTAENWTQLVKDRRLSETEAMMMQFAVQLEQLRISQSNPTDIIATNYFQFLPPAGILPLSGFGQKGFDAAKFFGAKFTTVAEISGDNLRVLLDEALRHEPIDLTTSNSIQLYNIKENQTQNVQKAMVFARHTLPYLGKPVPEQVTLTLAPNFHPMSPPQEELLRWQVYSNKATVPPTITGLQKPIRGGMMLILPNNAVVKGINVIGLQPDTSNPTVFGFKFELQELTKKAPESVLDLDLRAQRGVFKAKGSLAKPLKVNNETYQYTVSAEWYGSISKKPEIYSIQIVCEI